MSVWLMPDVLQVSWTTAAAGVEITKQTRLFFKVCIKASAIFSGLNMT